MSTIVYVKNTSDLQLNGIILAPNGRGTVPLHPNRAGILAPAAATAPNVATWVKKGRLQVITKAEFDEMNSEIEKPVVEEAPVRVEPRKTQVQKLPDGTTAMVQGIDEIPEIDALPEPLVANLSKEHTGIAVSAPKDDQPLTEAVGDPIKVPKADLRPRVLEVTGALREDGLGNTAELQPKLEKPAATVEAPKATEPLTNGNTAPDKNEASFILSHTNWRQQKKLLEACTDLPTIQAVQAKTKTDAIVKVCDSRIKELTK